MHRLLFAIAFFLSVSGGAVAQNPSLPVTTTKGKVCKPKTTSLATCQVTSTIFETVPQSLLPTCETSFATTTETTTITAYPSQFANATQSQYRTTVTETVFQTLETQITNLILQTEVVDVISVFDFNQTFTTLQTLQTQVTDSVFQTEVIDVTSVFDLNQTFTTFQTVQTQVTDTILQTEVVDLTTVQTAFATDVTTIPSYRNVTSTIPVNVTAVQTSVFVITQTSIVTISVEATSTSPSISPSSTTNSTATTLSSTATSSASTTTATSPQGQFACAYFKIYNYTQGAAPGTYVGIDGNGIWGFDGDEASGTLFTLDSAGNVYATGLKNGNDGSSATHLGPDGKVEYELLPVGIYHNQENPLDVVTIAEFSQYGLSHFNVVINYNTGVLTVIENTGYNYTGTAGGAIWNIDAADTTNGQYKPVTLAITCQPGPPVPPSCPSFNVFVYSNAVFGDNLALDGNDTWIDAANGVATSSTPSYFLNDYGNVVDRDDGSLAYVYPGGVSNITFTNAPNATQSALNCSIDYFTNNVQVGTLTCTDATQDNTFLMYQSASNANASSDGNPYGIYFAGQNVLASEMFWQATLIVQCSF